MKKKRKRSKPHQLAIAPNSRFDQFCIDYVTKSSLHIWDGHKNKHTAEMNMKMESMKHRIMYSHTKRHKLMHTVVI